ncbi:MAG: hypothetical protein WBA83_16960 [Burkholderiaceae bacterium]
MRNLYARFILFLIRPALERFTDENRETRRLEIIEATFNSIVNNGLVAQTIRRVIDEPERS